MPLVLSELLEKLKREDEVLLLELLGISSEDLVERFVDLIAQKQDYLEELLDDQ